LAGCLQEGAWGGPCRGRGCRKGTGGSATVWGEGGGWKSGLTEGILQDSARGRMGRGRVGAVPRRQRCSAAPRGCQRGMASVGFTARPWRDREGMKPGLTDEDWSSVTTFRGVSLADLGDRGQGFEGVSWTGWDVARPPAGVSSSGASACTARGNGDAGCYRRGPGPTRFRRVGRSGGEPAGNEARASEAFGRGGDFFDGFAAGRASVEFDVAGNRDIVP
jgi:hypothetical protein